MNSKIKKINWKNILTLLQENNLISFIKLYLKLILLVCSLVFPLKCAAEVKIINDAEVEKGIKHIVSPIIKAAGFLPKEVNVFILLDNDANAFAISGNNIFINTGLITKFKDVNVLKGVVAHEIGHITGGHIIRRKQKIEQLSTQTIITTLLGIVAVAGGASEAGGAIIASSNHTLERGALRFTRENEYSADQAALKLLKLSENSSEGLLKILEYFNRQQSTKEVKNYKYMITHPLTTERIFAVRNAGGWKLDTARNKNDQHIYDRLYAKLYGFIEDPKLIITSKISSDPFATNYMHAIAYYRLGELKKSLGILNDLIRLEPENYYLYELKAQFLFENGFIEQAIPLYEKAILTQGQNDFLELEFAIALIKASSKVKTKNIKDSYLNKAIILLNKYLVNFPYSPEAYHYLAIAYGKLNKIGISNLMLAEEAVLKGDFQKAEIFVQLAKRKGLNKSLQLKAEDIIKFISQQKNKNG